MYRTMRDDKANHTPPPSSSALSCCVELSQNSIGRIAGADRVEGRRNGENGLLRVKKLYYFAIVIISLYPIQLFLIFFFFSSSYIIRPCYDVSI